MENKKLFRGDKSIDELPKEKYKSWPYTALADTVIVVSAQAIYPYTAGAVE